jgi:hypothetical protein
MKRLLFLILICCSLSALNAQRYFHDQPSVMYGFKIGYNLPFQKQYSFSDTLTNSISAEFGAFFRAGKYVYGEIGFNYMFHKTTFNTFMDGAPIDAFAELRYLQIPIKALAYLPVGDEVAFMPNVGIIYQPLVALKNNDSFYNKSTIQTHQFVFTAGLGFRFHFFSLELNYRHLLRDFYVKKPGKHPNFLNFVLGFQF